MAKPLTRRDKIIAEAAAQFIWILDHGGNMDGYVRRYGAHDDPNKYGDGGEAIFTADMNEFTRLMAMCGFGSKEEAHNYIRMVADCVTEYRKRYIYH